MGPLLAALIPAATSLIGGLFSGKQAKKSANAAAGGARLQQLMPQILQMIQQQQANSAQNYQMQTQQQQANAPLQDAVRRMAMNLTPNTLKRPGDL
jgi:hypothetical protein